MISSGACSDHDGSSDGPELITIRYVSEEECVEICENQEECTHITLFRWDNNAVTHCWLSRGEYYGSEGAQPLYRPLTIDSGWAYCISGHPRIYHSFFLKHS